MSVGTVSKRTVIISKLTLEDKYYNNIQKNQEIILTARRPVIALLLHQLTAVKQR
jgi:hypothetical protein